MKIIVYTVNLGEYDRFRDFMFGEADWECYYVSDRIPVDSNWRHIVTPELDGRDLKRSAGYYKINSHLMPPHDISIYFDASVKVERSLMPLLDRFLQSNVDVMIPRHPNRSCVYDEAEACKRAGLDDTTLIDMQMGRYKAAGFPSRYGLPATTMIIRRNNDRVKDFNNAWWTELQKGSRRDQLSVMIAKKDTAVKFSFLPLNIYNNKFFKKCRHTKAMGKK